jgi:hypothetical protein
MISAGTSSDVARRETEHLKRAKIGDLIQVEINGSLQFEKPKRVRAIQELDGQSSSRAQKRGSRWRKSK